jgi:hypothetical protein
MSFKPLVIAGCEFRSRLILGTRKFSFIVLALCCLSFNGCVPIPSADERSPEISGRILDAVTGQPIQGARIALTEHPSTSALSDSSGHFKLHATHNIHLITILGPCIAHWPEGKYYNDTLDISHLNYVSRQIRGSEHLVPGATNVLEDSRLPLQDLVLTPVGR